MKYSYKIENIREWLPMVCNLARFPFVRNDEIYFDFGEISRQEIRPVHAVSFACLVGSIRNKQAKVFAAENDVSRYFWEDLNFRDYWVGGRNFVKSKNHNVLNLWRIVDSEKEIHSLNVHDYLKRHFFENKDLSAVKNSLDEAYYNIFDHAEANGNAFSFLQFDEDSQKLFVAVCDFGIGIASLVRRTIPGIEDDAEAILKAMENQFTTGSRTHNRGYGLGNILAACTESDEFCIIANGGQVVVRDGNISSFASDYEFPGTLIYYELSLSHFPDEEDLLDDIVL